MIGCGGPRAPLNVIFKNGTFPNSLNNVFTVVYYSDNDLKEFYTDILVKVNKDNIDFSLGIENGEKKNFFIDKAYEWYSVTKLFQQSSVKEQFGYVKFKDTLNRTYILNSKEKATFTFKVVKGDYNERTNSLKNIHDVSKEFRLEVKNVLILFA